MVLYNEKSLDSGSVSLNVGVRKDIAIGTEAYVCTYVSFCDVTATVVSLSLLSLSFYLWHYLCIL